MSSWKRGKFSTITLFLQIAFIILFWVFAEYDSTANAKYPKNNLDLNKGGADPETNIVRKIYPMFQDVHVMMFIGFGFLMTFLKRYGFGSISINFLVAALVLQWAAIIIGFIFDFDGRHFHFNIVTLIDCDFTSAGILISFGAVLGKTSPLQLVVMAMFEVVLLLVNQYIGDHFYKANDVGDSMYVHIFGAYFGIAVARVLYTKDAHEAEEKEGSVYHSDIFSMIGTIFLWMFWPSFNAGLAEGNHQQRAVMNTYFSLAACAVTAFVISSFVNKENKFNMIHIQNSTLAGGVAVGTAADMMLGVGGATIFGFAAAIVSVLGYKYLTPKLNKAKFHDTCGVNNLHGMPGIIAAIGGIIASGVATTEMYGNSLYQVFPARAPLMNSTEYLEVIKTLSIEPGDARTGREQAGWQAATLATTLGISIFGGIFTGLILRIPIWDQPSGDQVFDDTDYFELPEEGFPGSTAVDISVLGYESRPEEYHPKESGKNGTSMTVM